MWANGLSNRGNFLPIFDKEQRQKYATIALGECLSISLYEGLHERVLQRQESILYDETSLVEFELTASSTHKDVIENYDCEASNNQREETEKAQQALENIVLFLRNKLQEGENSLAKGIIKFTNRVRNIPSSKLASAFHLFGTDKFVSSHSTLQHGGLKRKRGKISVQPESVKRRKRKRGSRQQQSSGRQLELTVPIPKTKRTHSFSENVKRNENVAKKAGRSTFSKTKIFKQRSALATSTTTKNEP